MSNDIVIIKFCGDYLVCSTHTLYRLSKELLSFFIILGICVTRQRNLFGLLVRADTFGQPQKHAAFLKYLTKFNRDRDLRQEK